MGKKRKGLHQALATQQQNQRKAQAEHDRQRAAEQKEASRSKGKGKALGPPRPVVPFQEGQRILLVGEANFSFAVSLVTHHVPHSAALLVATAFDSRETAEQKYDDLTGNVDALRAKGATILFDIDAGALDKVKALKGQTFDAIVFNFPHVGAGEKDQDRNVRLNQVLLLRFLRSCPAFLAAVPSNVSRPRKRKRAGSVGDDDPDMAPVTDEDDPDDDGEPGSIFVTLRNAKPYTLWDLPLLAKKGPAVASSLLPHPLNRLPPSSQPAYNVVRSFAFPFDAYPGYAHRRTIGFQKGVSTEASEDARLPAKARKGGAEEAKGGAGEARTWQLQLKVP